MSVKPSLRASQTLKSLPSGFTDIKKPNVLHHPSGFTDIKKPNVLHHPMQGKSLHFNPKLKNKKEQK